MRDSSPASWNYHLQELDVARNPSDKRRSLPTVPEGTQRVLDIGCGAGQTLVASDLKGAKAFGLEIDLEALRLGRTLSSDIHFVNGGGEYLPFAPQVFDLVYSRVALPYMDIPKVLREAQRVLRPEGQVWFTLHPLSLFSLRNALSRPATALYEVYRLANTLSLHWFAWQFRYPLRRSRAESYQTERGIVRALERSGFHDIRIVRTHQFIVSARKKP